MPLRVLIMPDKFKGTLTAEAAADAIARGWRKARPADCLTMLPISDGGDGFGEVISRLLRARPRVTHTVDAASRPLAAIWWWEPKSGTVIIESARIVGLAMLPHGQFHPFQLDTFGLGAVIRAASALGARRCVVGLGGSATNDGGFGLARALGWKFHDASGGLIEKWTRLDTLKKIRAPRRRRWFHDLSVAVDVENPLFGARGASRVYGPQKGLRRGDFLHAERCLRRLALVVERQLGGRLARLPGAGAAGGLGFGFSVFADGRLVPGFSLFARLAGLERHFQSADLVITAEGRIDASTLMGKATGQVAQHSVQSGTPCLAFAGCTAPGSRRQHPFTQVHALTSMATLTQARAKPAFWLERLAAKVAADWPG